MNDFSQMVEIEEAVEGMLGMSLLSSLPSLLVSVATYVLLAVGMYAIARRRGIHHPWLAWIPFGSSWLLGCISDQYRYVARGQGKSKRKVLLVLDIITTAVALVTVVMLLVSVLRVLEQMDAGMDSVMTDGAYLNEVLVPFFGSLGLCVVMLGLAIAAMVVRYMAIYDLFVSCDPGNATIFTVLSILLGTLLESVLVFASRKKEGGMPPRHQQMYSEQPVWQPPQPPVEPWEMNNDH